MQCPQNPIVNLELLLETIPKVDAKPEAKKNNTTIDIAGKVGFDLNDAFNGTLTECFSGNDSVWGVTKFVSMCSGFNAVPSKYDETNFN
jgi:hypothetical protein